MHQVLVYADSLSWGIIPNTRRRLAYQDRWPGRMEFELQDRGLNIRVIEDCLNGRRTAWDDPIKPGRNGLIGLEQRIEVNSPLSVAILFLGTNDFQSSHRVDAGQSARGIAALVDAIRRSPIEPGMPIPDILLIAPPKIQTAVGSMAEKFEGAETKSAGLSESIRKVAIEKQCDYFNAAEVATTSVLDGVHLDKDQHHELGIKLAGVVEDMLTRIES
ncbi:SGNH/GDSL hydrolase family protein [Rhodopirellula bahusiensis]|uniref:GDSL family lipase n=1 Tax=Rhodopirellula bahusiensis TaxID=2014065 RepID=A0A2G1W4Z2_9BACT|nr:SGNH/GDSL hydrolase family protein [Rhodopirellula bahusiensis]PHQ34061.1 GDSL family lipase [Rhodopirellula bahusiensis]